MTHSERGYPVLVPAGRKIFETLHALAAGVWLGALVMGGATAGILFTTMRRLDPTFGVFDTYTGDMSNIGAGFIQNRVFLAMDFVQYGAATLVRAMMAGGCPLELLDLSDNGICGLNADGDADFLRALNGGRAAERITILEAMQLSRTPDAAFLHFHVNDVKLSPLLRV